MSDTATSPAPARDEMAKDAETAVPAPPADGASEEATTTPAANGENGEAEAPAAFTDGK